MIMPQNSGIYFSVLNHPKFQNTAVSDGDDIVVERKRRRNMFNGRRYLVAIGGFCLAATCCPRFVFLLIENLRNNVREIVVSCVGRSRCGTASPNNNPCESATFRQWWLQRLVDIDQAFISKLLMNL